MLINISLFRNEIAWTGNQSTVAWTGNQGTVEKKFFQVFQ